MPHPKGNVKLSGDIHLPDAESDLEIEEGTARMADLARERTQSGRRATHARKAGVLTAGDGDGAIAAVNRAGADTDEAAAANVRPAVAVRPAQGSLLMLVAGGLLLLMLVRKVVR